MNKTASRVVGFVTAIGAALVVAGCGSGSSDDDTVTVNGDVPLAYAKRAVTLNMNPTDGTPTAPGGDLIIREKSSASAREINVTAAHHAGQRRRVGPRGLLRRQEDRLLDALPDQQHRRPSTACRPAPAAGTSGNTT